MCEYLISWIVFSVLTRPVPSSLNLQRAALNVLSPCSNIFAHFNRSHLRSCRASIPSEPHSHHTSCAIFLSSPTVTHYFVEMNIPFLSNNSGAQGAKSDSRLSSGPLRSQPQLQQNPLHPGQFANSPFTTPLMLLADKHSGWPAKETPWMRTNSKMPCLRTNSYTQLIYKLSPRCFQLLLICWPWYLTGATIIGDTTLMRWLMRSVRKPARLEPLLLRISPILKILKD